MKRLLFPVLAFVAVAVAACGGGGGSGGPQPVTTATPTATPTAAPTSQSTGVTLSTTATTPATLGAISLNGGTYVNTATITFPVVNVTSSANITMTSAVPSGIPTPTAGRIHFKHPSTLGVPNTPLLYFAVTVNPGVTIAQSPAFTVNFATAQTGNCYVVVFDASNPSRGWNGMLGPQPCASTVTFPAIAFNPSQTLTANTQYVFAIVTTSGVIVTPTPSPTPSVGPTSQPTAASTPLYCAGMATPSAINGISPQPVQISDGNYARYGDQVVLYLTETDATTGLNSYLGRDGQLHQFSAGATAPPLPLNCFPGSNGGSGLTFEVPPPPGAAGSSENLYIALVAPTADPASSTAPSPLQFAGTGTGTNSQPGFAPNDSGANVPFDFVELGLPSGTVDTTQVNGIGLPLEMSVVNGSGATVAGPVGFPAGAYATIQSQLSSGLDSKLLVAGTLGSSPNNVLARILSPQQPFYGFPQDYFYNPSYAPSGFSDPTYGYIGYVLNQYSANPRLYTTSGIGGTSGHNYCAGYSSGSVTWWDVASATSCGTPPPTPAWTMSVQNYLEYTGQINYNSCTGQIMAMPWGPTSPLFASLTNPDLFYLWKAMVVDFARGQALSTAVHPVGLWGQHTSSFAATFPSFDPLYLDYWKVLHANADSNSSYAIPYDDTGAWHSGFTDVSGTLKISIDALPAPAVVNTPEPIGTPTACPVTP